ncbi:ABC transporter ATP-binding protein [Paracoccus aerodenitrificans]|uniref:ABC transporter ATP-binding protein n=1 Tax=Paracoccus aerodenitrificans TaxID=3017781 RepID=UPI0022F0DE0C|nr:ABC transporter ATP-binding protein [Paracoccus aerodenitrificans]WBU63547.1 ABC transporter ATP-binding protein [Paracoccus aerodenitrificans]
MPRDLTALNERLAANPPVHLSVKDLSVTYATDRGPFYAVDSVSFEMAPGSNLGLVGESGCGKSTVIKALMRLTPSDARLDGQVLLNGTDVIALNARQLQQVRWMQIALVTQSAMNSLDPVYRVGDQIVESIRAHYDVSHATAWSRAEEMFALVGLPARRLSEYPHQFSGGMRQRAVIAMALSLNAGLLLADEPTTALDPIMQDQVMARLRTAQTALHRSMILVTHDIAVVAETCESVAVMYAGRIVETGPTERVLHDPAHPYTMGLRNAFPKLPKPGAEKPPLISISGGLPNLLEKPKGCRFAPRCPFATDICYFEDPDFTDIGYGQYAACHHAARAPEFRTAAMQAETWKSIEA